MGVLWILWVRQTALGSQVSLGTLGQHLDQRNAAEHNALCFVLI